MPVSEAKRRANDRWDKANMTILSCKVKKGEAELFKEYCTQLGKTPNTVLKEYVYACVRNQEPVSRDDAKSEE